MRIEGYLLDIDGTLLDSFPTHLEAWVAALRHFGITMDKAEILSHFGKKSLEIGSLLLGVSKDSSEAHALVSKKTAYLAKYLPQIAPYPGVNGLLAEIVKQNGKICFISNNYDRIIDQMVDACNWRQFSAEYIGVDHVTNPKPDPEMLLKGMALIGKKPDECVMVGDSFFDIQAGKAAGAKTIAICTNHSREEFDAYSPDLVLSQFTDLASYLPLNL
jgi:HAD superfamily hydrolase (TIGR01509 family)